MTILKKFIKVAGLTSIACFLSNNSYATTSPTNLLLTVHKVAVSESPLCTNLVTILNNDAGAGATEMDFLANPTLGSGSIANGTYKCVVIEFSDTIKFTPAATLGVCTVGTQESLDVCSSGTTSKLIDGTTQTCSSSTEKIAMYLSTASSSTTGNENTNVFEPPTSEGDSSDAAHGLHLAAPMVVTGNIAARFIVNAANKIIGTQTDQSGNVRCEMQPPEFSFALNN
jgi:hypothetical protein